MTLTRRRAVIGVVVSWLSAGLAKRSRAARGITSFGKTTADRHGVLGRAYLQHHPQDASLSRLARLVPEDPVLRTRLVQADFAGGRVVILHGWVLSRTEGRYCALHTLASTKRG